MPTAMTLSPASSLCKNFCFWEQSRIPPARGSAEVAGLHHVRAPGAYGSDRLDGEYRIEQRAALPAVGFRDGDAKQALLRHELGDVPRIAAGMGALDCFFRQLLLCKAQHRIAERLLLGLQPEVHVKAPLWGHSARCGAALCKEGAGGKSSRARPCQRLSVGRRQAHGEAGPAWHHHPGSDGGQGGTLLDAVLAIETIASVCPRARTWCRAGNFGPIRVLAEYGSASQKQKFLQRLLAGESVIAVGMTEPDAGSAVTDLKTSATRDGGGYRINGSKIFTTHSAYAELFLVYRALRARGRRHRLGAGRARGAGREPGKASKFMSGEEVGRAALRRRASPEERVLLKEGGFKKQIAGFNVERIGNAARSLALGRYALRGGARLGSPAPAVRRLSASSRDCNGKFRRHEDEARRGASCCPTRGGQRRPRAASAEETAIARPTANQAGFDVANESLQVMGRHGLQPGGAGRVLPAPLPRLDDRRRLDRDPQEPHRRAHLRAQLFATPRIGKKGSEQFSCKLLSDVGVTGKLL